MTLSERLNHDMKTAMKNKDKIRLNVIRMLRSSMKNKEIELKRPLSEAEVLDVVVKELKQQRDSLAEFEQAGREDLAEKARSEIEILQLYLPDPLSESELQGIIQEVISELGVTSKADMGRVIAAVMPQVKGRAEGKTVSRLVRESLQ